MNSASLCSLAGRYDNPLPPRFLAPYRLFKIPALAGRYNNPIPTRCLAPIVIFKNSSSGFKPPLSYIEETPIVNVNGAQESIPPAYVARLGLDYWAP
jgi:hypothetical protein